ncbi:MAG: hypothetical protein IJQ98_13220, partial [Oscillospiraceae bacterium]|nr:hypothetical protein [Oscillospiraceae bacterium]
MELSFAALLRFSTATAHGVHADTLSASYLEGGSGYSIEAYSTQSTAYALETARFSGDFDWTLDANASGFAYGWRADAITVVGDLGGRIAAAIRSSYQYGGYTAHGIAGNLTVQGDITGTIEARSTSSSYTTASGISGSVTARSFIGHITASGAATAYGIYGGNVALTGLLGGEISASGGSAYGINATGLSADSVSGTVSATGSNYAYGIYVYRNGDALLTVTNDFGSEVSASSTSYSAYGIDVYNYNSSSDQSARLTVGGNLAPSVTVASTNSEAHGVRVYKNSAGRASLAVAGDFSGAVSVRGKTAAYGLEVCDYANPSNTYNGASTLEIGGVLSSDISVSASAGSAYGIRVSGKTGAASIAGGVTGDILVSAKGGAGYGIYSTSYIYGGSYDEALSISGDIIVNGTAVSSRAVQSGSLNISVSGTLYAGCYRMSSGHGLTQAEAVDALKSALASHGADQALHEELYNHASTHTVQGGAGDDRVELLSGGEIWGNIVLSAGTDTLTLHSGGSIYGDISSSDEGTLHIRYVLTGASDGRTIIQSVKASALVAENTSYTLDLGEASTGQYILASAEDLSSLVGRVFTVTAHGELSVGGVEIALSGGRKARLSLADGESVDQLVLDIYEATPEAPPAEPAFPGIRGIDGARTSSLRSRTDVAITENGSVAVGAESSRSADAYALRFLNEGRVL